MTQARFRLPPELAALSRSTWEHLIYEANLGKEDTELARRYFIDKECQIDIAIDLYVDRHSISRHLKKIQARIAETYARERQQG